MEKLRSYFFFDYRFKIASLWFKRLLYIYVIIRTSQWLIHYELLFGEHSLVLSQFQSIGFFKDWAFLLYKTSSPQLSFYFLIGLILLTIIRLFSNRLPVLCDILIWFLVLNIHNKVYPSLTGGDMLLNQFLLFNCFINKPFTRTIGQLASFQISLHNFVVIAVIAQICLLYFMAGLAKLGDESWVYGRAIILVSQIRHFSIFPSNYHSILDPFYIFLNYLVLFYQILFPFLVWIKKIKKPLLMIGIFMHVYIGLMMGLPEFSAVMIIGYVYFWPQKPEVN